MSLLLVRTFSASFGLLGGLHYGFLPFIHQGRQKGKSKDNFLGMMKISLIGKVPIRDGLNNFRENLNGMKGGEERCH